MNFVAIDFETANYARSSICAVGIAIVDNGKLQKTIHHLVKPFPNYYQFTWLHGIDAKMTNNQPDFEGVWSKIQPLLEDKYVIAHNAGFDFGVMKKTLEFYDIAYPRLEYYCSVVISRKVFPQLSNHKLDTVCNHLKIKLNHHEAESDATGAANIILKAAKLHQKNTFKELVSGLGIKGKKL